MLKPCCEQSMHSIDDDKGLGEFSETDRRSPIGKNMYFYECKTCGDQWCRVEKTHEPYDVMWHPKS